MWVPGSITYFIAAIVMFYRWLELGVSDRRPPSSPDPRSFMDVTASFLAGSILGWALPLGLLIAILIWWMTVLRRRGSEDG